MKKRKISQVEKSHKDQIFAASGRRLDKITMQSVLDNHLTSDDLRIHADTLLLQAREAQQAGFVRLAKNFLRAAELTRMPNDVVLSLYEALRPHRSSQDELEDLAERVIAEYQAAEVGALILEAARTYEQRKLLRKIT